MNDAIDSRNTNSNGKVIGNQKRISQDRNSGKHSWIGRDGQVDSSMRFGKRCGARATQCVEIGESVGSAETVEVAAEGVYVSIVPAAVVRVPVTDKQC